MFNLCGLFLIINIFTITVNSLPTGNNANMFDILKTYVAENCSVLSTNVLINTTKYMSSCKQVNLNQPEKAEKINMNEYYCIGIMGAEFHLCRALAGKDYQFLPKDYGQLKTDIKKISEKPPNEVCKEFQQFPIFYDTPNITFLPKLMTTLNENLKGSNCVQLCSEMLFESNTNSFCSMLYYINQHIIKIDKVVTQSPESGSIQLQNAKNVNNIRPVIQDNQTKKVEITQSDTKLKISKPPSANIVKTPLTVKTQVPKKKVDKEPPPQPKLEESSSTPFTPPYISAGKNNDISAAKSEQITTSTVSSTVGVSEVEYQPVISQPLSISNGDNLGQHKENREQHPTNTDKKDSTNNKDIANQKQNVPVPSPVPETKLPAITDDANKVEVSEIPANNEAGSKSSTIVDSRQDYDEDDDVLSKTLGDEPNLVETKGLQNFRGSRPVDQNAKKFVEVENSNFFSYFMFISVIFIAGYVIYHNKQKIMALLLEGRRDRNSRRRPNTASYRKLNSNLEEAVTSKCSGSASHVIY